MDYVIYKITINDRPEFIYVGHTRNFINRKHYHKFSCNKNIERLLYKTINENGGWENCNMVIIDNLTGSLTDARIRENYWYDLLKANMNAVKPFTTYEERKKQMKEYRENNHEVILEKKKEYYYANQQKDNARSKEYRETHQEEMKEYKKEWHEKNKERIHQKNNEKIKCDCGHGYTRANKAQHFKTKRHLDSLENPKP